jgi:hypothetical protein
MRWFRLKKRVRGSTDRISRWLESRQMSELQVELPQAGRATAPGTGPFGNNFFHN